MSFPSPQPAAGRHPGPALPKVIYVGSTGRSGSTLVGRILGEAPGAVCVGETRYLWTRGLIDDVRCGCGQRFRSCAFWTAVGDEAFGGWDSVDSQRMAALDRVTVRLRSLPLYWSASLCNRQRDSGPGGNRAQPTRRHWQGSSWRNFGAAIEEYVAALTALYSAIASVSGAGTVIDISKEPNFALLLTYMPHSDVRIVHLVRDSRAVAYSWTRRKPMPSPIGGEHYMPQFNPTDQATRWMFWNAAFYALGRKHPRYTRIQYETLVGEPRQTLTALESFVDEPLVETLPAPEDATVTLGEHHMFSGNPMRADTGDVKMRIDDEWQWKMPTAQLAMVTAITWPQLRRYGYKILPAQRYEARSAPRP